MSEKGVFSGMFPESEVVWLVVGSLNLFAEWEEAGRAALPMVKVYEDKADAEAFKDHLVRRGEKAEVWSVVVIPKGSEQL